MAYRLAADAVVLLHLAVIVFMVIGGFLAWRWRRLVWLHVPLALWGAVISVFRFRCPLTPLELHFRDLAGQSGYDGGFIDHYVMAVVYPSGLTPTIQFWMAAGLVALNVLAYGVWWRGRGDSVPSWNTQADGALRPPPVRRLAISGGGGDGRPGLRP
jgi:hypothetical protein